MNCALFFKNVKDYTELEQLTTQNKGVSFEYEIIGRVDLIKNDYEAFCRNFVKGYSFLCPFVELSRIRGNVWRCVLVTHDDCPSVLVMTNGYQYPRFVALQQEFSARQPK